MLKITITNDLGFEEELEVSEIELDDTLPMIKVWLENKLKEMM